MPETVLRCIEEAEDDSPVAFDMVRDPVETELLEGLGGGT